MDIPTLTTERLVLRPFRLDDFDAYAAMNADARVMRYIGEDRAGGMAARRSGNEGVDAGAFR